MRSRSKLIIDMANTQELLDNARVDISRFSCNVPFICPYNERSLSYAIGIETPVINEVPEEIFRECKYVHTVLADINSNDDLRNDYSSFFHQRQLSNETVEFILVDFNENKNEIIISDDTYGEFFDFGHFENNRDFKGVLIQWKKVLEDLGEGAYKIIKRQTLAGINFETESLVYDLRQYSDRLANFTTRIDIVQNGSLREINTDFTGLNWDDSIRVRGFFGNRQPQYEEDNLVNRGFERRQISMSQTNEYRFQSNLIPSCVTDQIIDFFLFGNDIFITDYNLNNHSYNYRKFPVKFQSNDETDYGVRRRKARLNLTFSDKVLNKRKNNFY